ncbi:Uncharacterised protein [BD1-7 clade bacterium]|uniref:Lipid A deacylase LpxR family protein n=1 Tax=BD1-7 clade bacterium TaxID=2029982 RepID=A0A5S9QPW8_9GAMM|nr:Uncharacterised protein [BD1-7 clade bacterium]
MLIETQGETIRESTSKGHFSPLVVWISAIICIFASHCASAAPHYYTQEALDASDDVTAWRFSFEDDYFAPINNEDDNYSFGFSATQAGKGARESFFTLAPAVNWFDSWWGFKPDATDESISIGFFGLTPDNKTTKAPVDDDRPYASLVYWSSSQFRVSDSQREAIFSGFTIGILGLPIGGTIQNGIHDVINNGRVKGWGNQISHGGEPTFKYSLHWQQNFMPLSDLVEIKQSLGGSAGYLTQASWSLSMRIGKLATTWWSDHPELDLYGESSGFSAPTKGVEEVYFSAGFQFNGRLYNALVQGQFRDSAVTYNFDETRHFIASAWMAFTMSFKSGIRIRYFAQTQSSEFKSGVANRTFYWAGLSFTQAFK